MNTRLTVAAIAAALLPATAFAGGYVPPVIAPVIVAPAPVLVDWSGAYVGVTAGYGFNGDDEVGFKTRNGTLVGSPFTFENSGPNGGLHIGFRNQFDRGDRAMVAGIELSYEAGDVSDDVEGIPATSRFSWLEGENTVDSVLALRVKAGGLSEDRQTFFYGILGAAQGNFTYSFTDGAALNQDYEYDATGYIIGLGVERRINEDLSFTVELEHTNYGQNDLDVFGGYTTIATPEFTNIKVGLNYQF